MNQVSSTWGSFLVINQDLTHPFYFLVEQSTSRVVDDVVASVAERFGLQIFLPNKKPDSRRAVLNAVIVRVAFSESTLPQLKSKTCLRTSSGYFSVGM